VQWRVKDLSKADNINIKLEISKDKDTNELVITTRFDPSASNFFKDENGYVWLPTPEEIKFINDAFELVPTGKIKSIPQEKKIAKTVEKREEKVQTYKPQVKVEEKIEETSPFERKMEKKPVASAEKKEEEMVFEVTAEEQPSEERTSETTKGHDEGVIVKADDKAIERALKKDVDEDNSIKEVDEKTIIDKVLSQKKKGKWSRPSR